MVNLKRVRYLSWRRAMSDMVPNPRREELEKALRQIRRLAEELESSLDLPYRLSISGEVMQGRFAEQVGTELAGHRRDMRRKVNALIEELEGEVRGMPQKIPGEDVGRFERSRRFE